MPKDQPNTDFRLLTDLPDFQLNHFPQNDAVVSIKDNEFIPFSSSTLKNTVDKVSAALIQFGIEPGDKVAIISDNCPEWNFIDLGIQQIGAVNVPVYTKISDQEYEYIFNDAGVRLAFVSTGEVYKKLKSVEKEISTLEDIYSIEKVENVKNWLALIEEKGLEGKLQEVENRKAELNHTERVKKFALIADDWSVETGELTPTLKIKRPVLKNEYEETIAQLYQNNGEVNS